MHSNDCTSMAFKCAKKVKKAVEIRQPLGHWRVWEGHPPQPLTKTSGQRPLSFSSGGDLGGAFAAVSVHFYVAKNHLHFYNQNLENTKVWGSQNGSKNWFVRALGVTFLLSFFTSHFASIFPRFSIDFWKPQLWKIAISPRENHDFYKIGVFAMETKFHRKITSQALRFGSQNHQKTMKNQ